MVIFHSYVSLPVGFFLGFLVIFGGTVINWGFFSARWLVSDHYGYLVGYHPNQIITGYQESMITINDCNMVWPWPRASQNSPLGVAGLLLQIW